MFPCHTRVDGEDGVLYDSNGDRCSTWRSFSDETRYLMIAGIVVVGVTLLGLGTLGIVRYVRRRNRRNSDAMMVPERLMTAMSAQGYSHHRQSKSMVSTPVRGSHREHARHARSRSSSVSSNQNQTPSPSPLRQAQYPRPFSGGYEEHDLGSRQPMMAGSGYRPVSMAFDDHGYAAYPAMMQPYGNREDTEYLRDMSRSGSMMEVGHGRA